jgi:hypothetical protein
MFVSAEAFAAAGRNKKKQTGFQTVQNGKKIYIHEVHMYMIGSSGRSMNLPTNQYKMWQ